MTASFGGTHLCMVTASEQPGWLQPGRMLKRPTAMRDLKENYGNGPPGRVQRHLAQNLPGLWKAHPNTSPGGGFMKLMALMQFLLVIGRDINHTKARAKRRRVEPPQKSGSSSCGP